ncbi:mechanosensitive ion channel family protein [Candidatus Pacearchaeota archaeon]|nr:MAG: mechanosensitive ion channel family protein [Candidatus Pacearchaeota archaeon]
MFADYLHNQYLRALIVFILVFVVVRVVLYIIGRVLPKLTAKTKTNLDDIIIKKTSTPLTWMAILAGVRFAIGELRIDETLSQTINEVILTVLIIVASVLIYHVVNAVITVGLSEFNKKKKAVNESIIQFFHSIVKIVIFIGAFLVILASWGIEIGPLLAGVGVAGIAIAFALQSTLSNVFGGISVILDKSINVGDVIKLSDGTSGKIVNINLRSTKIVTFDNELIIVPNSKLSEGKIQNIALPEPKARVVVPFGVAYGADVDKVKKIVLSEIRKVKHFVPEPEPSVKFLEMADSSLNFKAFFYVDSYTNRYNALDEANTRIYNALNKNKIEIPFPQMDVHLKNE